MEQLIRKVFFVKFSKQKMITIPKDHEIKPGDYVEIIKVKKNA